MRTEDEIQVDLQEAYERYRQALTDVAHLSLEAITQSVTQSLPQAMFLKVEETDQDMSGALVAVGWVDDAGADHNIDDSVTDVVSGELGNLDDSCQSQWQPYVVQDDNGRNWRLDLTKLREQFA